MPHTLNFIAGWWLILAAFVSGAVIGLGFHREEFLVATAHFAGGCCAWGILPSRRWAP